MTMTGVPRILLVEDMQSVKEMVIDLLKKNNFQVAGVGTGKAALTKLRSHDFDLILLDVNLPDMDGFEICKKIKENPATSDIPVIFLSVLQDKDSVLKGLREGGDDYIAKPFNDEELLARINVHINLKFAKDELRVAKERAEFSDQIKSVFLANMSHDIRTPMNAIIGFSGILQSTDYSEEEKNYFLQTIVDNGQSLIRLIDDIIDVSRMEAGELKIATTSCNLNRLLDEVYQSIEMILSQSKKSGVVLRITKPVDTPDSQIMVDGFRLKQILFNLLSNASKFTTQGSIEFGYYFKQDPSDSSRIYFYVKDTGTGISTNRQEQVFQRFAQADPSVFQNHGGTGLGLTITRDLLKLMGGEIFLESELGKGSNFFFYLPYQKAEQIEKNVVSASNEKAAPETKRTILIIDDVKTVLKYLNVILTRAGYKVLEADSGTAGLDLYIQKKNEIDMVLLDLQMPDITGFEIASKIRETDTEIPIIAQTALAMEEDREHAMDAGCTDVITKPIESEVLFAVIEKYL